MTDGAEGFNIQFSVCGLQQRTKNTTFFLMCMISRDSLMQNWPGRVSHYVDCPF